MTQELKAYDLTLSNIGSERMIKLQRMAMELIGRDSVSALVRHIVDNGHVKTGPSTKGTWHELVVPEINATYQLVTHKAQQQLGEAQDE